MVFSQFVSAVVIAEAEGTADLVQQKQVLCPEQARSEVLVKELLHRVVALLFAVVQAVERLACLLGAQN